MPPDEPGPLQAQSSTSGAPSGPAQDGWHLAASHATTGSPDPGLHGDWRGRRWPLFKLALWTGLLTVLTLGLYRFWARTRIRRWYWSAIRPAGFPLEYVGTPYEKLLGFLVAVVILAFYIGVVNLLLIFVSFSLLSAPGLAYALTLVGLVPIWFYATYRAQRYLLARTRWMGLRFGLEPGAWGYAARACWHWALTILTLGMWHPRLRWALARYRHDRMFYGTQRLAQGGHATMLYPAFVHLMIGGFLTAGTVLLAGSEAGPLLAALDDDEFTLLDGASPAWRMLYLGVPWLIFGLVHYSVEGRKALIAALSVGATGFDPQPSVGKVLWITLSGNAARYGAVILLAMVASGLLIGAALTQGLTMEDVASADPEFLFSAVTSELPTWLSTGIVVLFYFVIFLIWNVLTHIFLTMPTWRHYAQTLTLTGTAHLATIDQRARDESREAGGFAEALDVGAAI
ncbi:MAG: DUF898 family protein [Pseudomonadota bacterium]